MSHVIGKKCISTCDTGCLNVCPVDCIHGPININGEGAEVPLLREQGKLEGLQLYIDPDTCIDCGACIPECPPNAIFEDEAECIEAEGNDESVKNNYNFFKKLK